MIHVLSAIGLWINFPSEWNSRWRLAISHLSVKAGGGRNKRAGGGEWACNSQATAIPAAGDQDGDGDQDQVHGHHRHHDEVHARRVDHTLLRVSHLVYHVLLMARKNANSAS